MIHAYMNVDKTSKLARTYNDYAIKSFECVKDVFHIEAVQCVLPDTNYLHLDPSKGRSPQEAASLASHYRTIKQMSYGNRVWMLEHDAYLLDEKVFRDLLLKYKEKRCTMPGIAVECYNVDTETALKFCEFVENDFDHTLRGPMSILHRCTDMISKANGESVNTKTLWPKRGKDNQTGVGPCATIAHSRPQHVIPAIVTQIVDLKHGSTVDDRGDLNPIYNEKTHPNFKFVDIML